MPGLEHKHSATHAASRIARTLANILSFTSKTDIDSQIEFLEMLNNEMIKSPVFISIIQSLKELKAIKKERIPCKHNYVSSVAYKGAKICTKCDKIK